METKEICEKIIMKHNGTYLKGKSNNIFQFTVEDLGLISCTPHDMRELVAKQESVVVIWPNNFLSI